MNIQKTKPDQFPISTEVISDGKINTQNLEKLNLNQQGLEQQLKMSGMDSISDVFYDEVLKNGTLYIDNNNDVLH
ncbi:YetF domain-containing protein [Bacillus sp. M6-12]|uniref:YetF domain-containing protein n=1 Tax=Bacillus sp. M6-12 TaxID=2054166 RepID=UPI0015E0B844|nr:YetF domain-containing protein [Bacillus sp. M6-12]